jgi:hypothetical protein
MPTRTAVPPTPSPASSTAAGRRTRLPDAAANCSTRAASSPSRHPWPDKPAATRARPTDPAARRLPLGWGRPAQRPAPLQRERCRAAHDPTGARLEKWPPWPIPAAPHPTVASAERRRSTRLPRRRRAEPRATARHLRAEGPQCLLNPQRSCPCRPGRTRRPSRRPPRERGPPRRLYAPPPSPVRATAPRESSSPRRQSSARSARAHRHPYQRGLDAGCHHPWPTFVR